MSATPRPWHTHELPVETLTGSKRTEYIIHGLGKYRLWDDLQKVCALHPGYARDDSTREANAHLIVRAVNAHDDLLAAAKEARDELSQYTAPWCEELAAKLDEAIEKAEQ